MQLTAKTRDVIKSLLATILKTNYDDWNVTWHQLISSTEIFKSNVEALLNIIIEIDASSPNALLLHDALEKIETIRRLFVELSKTQPRVNPIVLTTDIIKQVKDLKIKIQDKINVLLWSSYKKPQPIPLIRILIGDDLFEHADSIPICINLLISSLARVFDTRQNKVPISIIETSENSGIFTIKNSPTGGEIIFTTVATPQAMIAEAKNDYDWKITDLDYGRGQEAAGQQVLKELARHKKPNQMIGIFTLSNDELDVLEGEIMNGADFVIAPRVAGSSKHKIEELGIFIGEYYLKKQSL